jgi:ligand-binding sensor domain-containing protein
MLTRYWALARPLEAVFVVLGQRSLGAFILHVYGLVILSHTPLPDDIWISTLGNPKGVLTRWERATETFHRYTPADGIPEHAPSAFGEDAAGNIWIGFYLGGLMRYSQGRFKPFTEGDGVPPGFVEGLYLDHAGRLWVATAEGGVARTDDPGGERPSFFTYSAANGLASNQGTCVTEDQSGMIYIGTGRGVDKLDPATGHIKHFTTADGLAGSYIIVAFRHHDGSLWFGTQQGLSRLVPQPERPTLPPPVLISAMRIAGVSYPISELGELALAVPEISASRNQIQIDFVGLGDVAMYQVALHRAYFRIRDLADLVVAEVVGVHALLAHDPPLP